VKEQSQTLTAVKTAIQMEIDGKQYYQQAAQASQNDLGRKLFLQLATEEDSHRKKFEEIYQALRVKESWPDVSINLHQGRELKTLFAIAGKDVKSSTSELEAVQTAMSMENKTRDFYQLQAKKADFSIEKDYYEALAKEESAHHAVLLDYYEYLHNPAGWFTMKERHSLDGG
jgi:rubrerythrin